ncbi:MAG TPA: class I SAM-dependent methyltransferase [Puia sp.]
MKDNFSAHSDKYAQFRPVYPDALYDFLLSLVPARDNAWDCGTGNGQVAQVLVHSFAKIYATDISRQQIENAFVHERIEYSVQAAENTSFPDNSFDLITVAQAIHWFDFGAFYGEVNRTIRGKGVLGVIGYGLIRLSPSLDAVIAAFYRDIVGPYWDKERRYIDDNYRTIPFPFDEVESPSFENIVEWTFEHLIGYLGTWSAVKHYEKATEKDPVDLIRDVLKKAWGAKQTTYTGRFPILLRVARIEK